MNIFVRSIFWALPVWAILIALRFIYIPYDFWTDIVQTVIHPGVIVCLWFVGLVHCLDWFWVITANLVIYYLAVVLVVFVIDRLRPKSRL